jgi:hypothetical protein
MIGGETPGNLLPVRPVAVVDPVERALDAQWDAAAFLATVDEISNPVQPIELPTGPALFAGLFDH